MSMTTSTPVNEETFRRLALGNSLLELHHGQVREKPGMSVVHGDVVMQLAALLYNHLDRNEYRVRAQHARLRVSTETYYVPDVAVVPTALERALRDRPYALDAYPDPLPLVIEVWSPSTGDYDIKGKLPDYQARGDMEIWYVHPYERTVTVWSRRPDGSYDEIIHRGGIVRPASLPGVVIDLEDLFQP